LSKTKIIATVGPACASPDVLRQLVEAGVHIFRLNFAHGGHDEMARHVGNIRKLGDELDRPIGILGDLGGPKIRLGDLPGGMLQLDPEERYAFVGEEDPQDPKTLTTTHDGLLGALQVGNRVLLADGMVSLRVVEKSPRRAVCVVERPGTVRSGQGVNLPGVRLSLPTLTDKDGADLEWMMAHEIDFVGLSFVRSADDVRELRRRIGAIEPERAPLIVAKIEKREAVDQLDEILGETDAVMVARGDLGVDVDVAEVPLIQKRIIRACNRHQVPVITATQMLDSMERNPLPTRAEASDVANAVLDGTDAVMLSGETAIGEHPLASAQVMHRIVCEAEGMVAPGRETVFEASSRNIATQMTRAVAQSALHAAEEIGARLIAVVTWSGRTAVAVSALRNTMPILAITGSRHTARRLSIAWGVSALATERFDAAPRELLDLVVGWGREQDLLEAGDRIVLVGTTDWTQDGKNLMVVQTIGQSA